MGRTTGRSPRNGGPTSNRGLAHSPARRRPCRNTRRIPAELQAIPLHHSDTLYGWLLLRDRAPAFPDDGDLLAVLASQVAATLNSIRLIDERVASERLSAIGRMISALVHDLRNPMTAIKGYASMFQEFELPRDRQKECARLIADESDRMGAMIDETLEFSRGDKLRLRVFADHHRGPRARRCPPRRTAFAAKRISFADELHYSGDVLVDVCRLKRAILNIASCPRCHGPQRHLHDDGLARRSHGGDRTGR